MTIINKDVKFKHVKTTIRIEELIWDAFSKAAQAHGGTVTVIQGFDIGNQRPGTALPIKIKEWLAANAVEIPKTDNAEIWLGSAVAAMAPHFKAAGFPLGKLPIIARLAFPSTGWKGKTRGEAWSRACTPDGTRYIFIHPGETDAKRILDILVHELCHVADEERNGGVQPKQVHGKHFQAIGEAVGLSGKPKEMMGSHLPAIILETVGPLPHSALAEFVAKEKKPQKNRQLKLEHEGCPKGLDGKPMIWRMALSSIATQERICCPCCMEILPNPYFGEGDEDGEGDTVESAQEKTENRLRGDRNHHGDATKTQKAKAKRKTPSERLAEASQPYVKPTRKKQDAAVKAPRADTTVTSRRAKTVITRNERLKATQADYMGEDGKTLASVGRSVHRAADGFMARRAASV